jgi:hypothetical protein
MVDTVTPTSTDQAVGHPHLLGRSPADLIEVKISQYIGVMPFIWLDVPSLEMREHIESGAIVLLPLRTGGVDPGSIRGTGRSAGGIPSAT